MLWLATHNATHFPLALLWSFTRKWHSAAPSSMHKNIFHLQGPSDKKSVITSEFTASWNHLLATRLRVFFTIARDAESDNWKAVQGEGIYNCNHISPHWLLLHYVSLLVTIFVQKQTSVFRRFEEVDLLYRLEKLLILQNHWTVCCFFMTLLTVSKSKKTFP